jgi:hypothetical protein
MKKTKLNYEELNKRCGEVFILDNHETVFGMSIEDDGTVKVCIDDGEYIFDYLPDMSERPEALSYILGERDDFND